MPGQLVGGRLAETAGRTLALRYAGLYGAAVVVGLAVRAAGAGVLGVVAVVNTVGGLVVALLLGRQGATSTTAASRL